MLRFLATVLAYMVAVFPLAYWWHLVLFRERLEAIGYLGRDEPIVPLGFVAIAVQGLLLAALSQLVGDSGAPFRDALLVTVPFIATIWTAQVLAHAAKFEVEIGPFLAIETGYFVFQAVLVALAVGLARLLTA